MFTRDVGHVETEQGKLTQRYVDTARRFDAGMAQHGHIPSGCRLVPDRQRYSSELYPRVLISSSRLAARELSRQRERTIIVI